MTPENTPPENEKDPVQSVHEDIDKIEKKEEEKAKKKKGMSPAKKIALVLVVLFFIGIGGMFAHSRYKYESTDDAYVQAYSTQLSPKVSAIVTHVLVQENQTVKAGQILAQLERKDFESALRDATASLGAIQAQLGNAKRDFERSEMLVRGRAISRQQFDHAKSNYVDLQRQASAASARVDEARLNLEYATVRAPSDGQIGRRSVDVGMYVAAGTAILGFVPSDERWVDAYYKETQLDSVAPGKRAEVTVDAIPGKTYTGIVESISPSTGATFTLMPPDNATGNFTKVVQRVPVRLRLQNLSADDIRLLHAGLSANVDLLKHVDPVAPPAPPAPLFSVDELPLSQAQRAGQEAR